MAPRSSVSDEIAVEQTGDETQLTRQNSMRRSISHNSNMSAETIFEQEAAEELHQSQVPCVF